MMIRYLATALAAFLLAGVAGGTEPAASACSKRLDVVQADVAVMRDARLRARADEAISAARASAAHGDERACLRHLRAATRARREERRRRQEPGT